MENTFDYKSFYVTWYSRAKAFAMEFVGNQHDAEEIIQEVFLGIYEKRQFLSLESGGINLTAYLLTSIKNRCLNLLKSRLNRKVLHIDDQEQVFIDRISLQALEQFDTDFPDQDVIEARLKTALDKLPNRCRQIFVMNKINGIKQKDIASSLGLSVNTVESQMAIAYKKLREELRDCLPILLFLINII
ncbi:MAG: RNA polymerase sigma-70 factor [Bacteroidales bacterium]|nr:RNA polymerase sigma-70 factor [Bacteroidales bacterium]